MSLGSAATTVELVPIGNLKPSPRNARKHSERQLKLLAKSITTFGFNAPAIVDGENNILVGHGRWQAAQRAGLNKIPVIRVTHLTETQARAYAIADNRLSDHATWDDRLLGEIFADLAKLDLDFSLESTGFTMGEIDMRIEALGNVSTSDEKADAIPTCPGPPLSRPGDIWRLGRHRLLCGNALERQLFTLLMQDELAAMSFIDAPYNVPINGHASGRGRVHHREFAMATGEMSVPEFTRFLTLATTNVAQSSLDGSVHYACIDWRHFGEALAAGEHSFTKLLNVCVWIKHNAGMGSFYRSQYEAVFVFRAGKAQHRNNVELGRNGRNRANVWGYPGANSFGHLTDEGYLLALHPTVKPVRLVADAIRDCTARQDIILDPFLGSGTTVIACERTGRRCYGIEIDPLYVDTTIRRWQAYSGEHAIHATSLRRFDDIAAESLHIG
jgi:DNA modification methylase